MLSPIDRLEIRHFHHDFQRTLKIYSDALKLHVLSKSKTVRDKQRLSHERILEQTDSYFVLYYLWLFSPYSSGSTEWTHESTAYGIAKALPDGRKPAAALDYVNRVIDAASAFELVERQDKSANKIVLRGTQLLDDLMTKFALEVKQLR